VAHGLMAISAMEIIDGSSAGTRERRFGCASLALVLAKAVYEALTGRMFLEFLHFGLLGSPVAVSHAGGIFGGLLAWFLLSHSSAPRVSDHGLPCHGFPRRCPSSAR
jgi:hypothetical protein